MAEEHDERVVTCWALAGIPEVQAGNDLAELIANAISAAADQYLDRALRDGDVLVVTSKVVSKAEGRSVAAADREDAITAETVRVVATRPRADGLGVTRIVENRLGMVSAAAGVDASNTADGTVLLLPLDPDDSARRLCRALRDRFGVVLGVVISDTLGRAWRVGQTDAAIGSAGISVIEDLRGTVDAAGHRLEATVVAVADEIAAMADLVKRKAAGTPVAVVRGLPFVCDAIDTPGARTLVRSGEHDMFRLGTDEAIEEGYRRAQGEAGNADHLTAID